MLNVHVVQLLRDIGRQLLQSDQELHFEHQP